MSEAEYIEYRNNSKLNSEVGRINFAEINSEVVKKINRRVKKFGIAYNKIDLAMDSSATHAHTPLCFATLTSHPDNAFIHDIIGIRNNMCRKTGRLKNCFLPKCTIPEINSEK